MKPEPIQIDLEEVIAATEVTNCFLCGEERPYYKPTECRECYIERHSTYINDY